MEASEMTIGDVVDLVEVARKAGATVARKFGRVDLRGDLVAEAWIEAQRHATKPIEGHTAAQAFAYVFRSAVWRVQRYARQEANRGVSLFYDRALALFADLPVVLPDEETEVDVIDTVPAAGPGIEEAAERSELRDALSSALDHVAVLQRDAMVSVYARHETVEDFAKRRGISTQAVYSRLDKARATMRRNAKLRSIAANL